jgi:hypothetical protein
LVSGPGRRVTLVAGACGTLLAALALTKINLGSFAIAAVALAAVLTVEPLHRRLWVRWPVVAAFLAMPVFLLARDLSESWVRNLVLLEILAATAILMVAWSVRPKRGDDDAALRRWLLAAAIGFALAFAAIVAVILLTGPTPADVYEGMFGEAIRAPDVLVTPLLMPSAVVDWGIAAVAAAALTTLLRSREVEEPTIWPGLLAGGCRPDDLVHGGARGPVRGQSPCRQSGRAAISARLGGRDPALSRARARLPALPAGPAAGSGGGRDASGLPGRRRSEGNRRGHLRPGRGALPRRCADMPARLERRRRRPQAGAPRCGGGYGDGCAARDVCAPLDRAVSCVERRPLPEPTGAAVRRGKLAASSVARRRNYTGVVDLLHRYRCTTFIGYPSINSLYLWSSIDPPQPTTPGTWATSLDGKWQQRVVDDMRASPRPCAVRTHNFWLRGAAPPARPLVRYIFDDFKPVARAGDFQFLLPKARALSGDGHARFRGAAR